MRLKTLVAVAVAAAFAGPLLSQAQGDKPAAGATTPGSAMDKDKDGSISREEAKGTPLEKDFDKLDKNSDGKLSRDEQAAAKAGAGATAPEAPKKQ
jgi:EF hand